MRFFLAFLGCASIVPAQVCAPAERIAPVASANGAIAENNCRLTDGTPYAEYSLVLPTRGRLEADAQSDAFGPQMALRDVNGHAVAGGASIRGSFEAGAYRLVLRTGASGQTGAFTLRTGFTPEPNTACRALAPLGLTDAANGRLTDSSCRMPDGTRYDAYRVETLGDGTLEIAVESSEARPFALLRSGEGRALASSDDGRISYAVSGDRTYVVVVGAADPGSYKVSSRFTPGDGETCRPLKTFTATDQHTGAITRDGCTLTDPMTGDEFPYTWYELQVAEFGMAELRAGGRNFGPALELLGPDGASIASDYWGGGPGQPLIRYQLRPGRYTVRLFSSVPAAGEYNLQYTFRPGAVSCPLLTLNPGAQLSGTLSGTSSCRAADGVADVYQITTPGPGTLEIGLASNDFDTFLVLRDAADNRIVADDDSGDGTNSYIAADLPAGVYSVAASALDAPGAYSIAARFTPRAVPACDNIPVLEGGYAGDLSLSTCRAANGQPADIYGFTTPADGTVALLMSSNSLNSFLELTDSQGNVIRRDDNSLGENDALIVQFLPAGTYRVTARDAETPVAGLYQVLRYFAPGDRGPGCRPARSLNAGDAVTARLDLTSCEYPDNTFADIYQLTVSGTTPIVLAMDSSDFDAFLVLLDSKGNVVGEDDDSGGKGNALLSQPVEAGTYYVVAKSASGYTGGQYKLSLATSQ